MALRTPARPSRVATPAPRRGGGRGMLIFVFLVVVALGVGYLTLPPTLTAPRAQPTPPTTLRAEYLNDYTTFFDDYGATLPEGLAVDDVRERANDCVQGAMPPNSPSFLPTDALLRARASWVCLVSTLIAVRRSDCNAPGTGELLRPTVERGHLVAVRLGGYGNVRDDRGGCMNITPLDRQTNTLMRDGLENEAHTRASSGETVFYLSVPVYFDTRVTPMSVYLFAIGTAGASMGQYDNPKHLWESGASAR